MEKSQVNTHDVYQFIKQLVTPFDEWKAYDLGIIDECGRILKPKLNESERHILNLKKLFESIRSGGKSELALYTAAYWMINEGKDFGNNTLTKYEIRNMMEDVNQLFETEVPANNTSNIATNPRPMKFGKKKKKKSGKHKKEIWLRDINEV